jgi:signal transduction histidine kinase
MLFTLSLGVAEIERDKSLAELEAAVDELALLNSRLRQRAWLARKTLAMELHGSIQSTLQSVAARLSKLKDPTDEELAQVLAQVREAFNRVDHEDYLSGKSLRHLLEELEMLWDGALDVEIQLDENAEESLQLDQAAARCVLEVCREAITNAVKHGQAEQVRISVLPGNSFVSIRALNDGIQITSQNKGQGLALYKEVAHNVALTNTADGVMLELTLPIRG